MQPQRFPMAERAYARPSMGIPEARLINLFLEATPHGPNEFALMPRPALVSGYSLGSGPIRGQFYQPGVFSSAHFAVSATTAYLSSGSTIGTIAGTDAVRFAGSPDQVVAVANGLAYLYEGVSFAQITDPDLPNVSDVAYLAGRFIFTDAGSDRVHWSEVADAGNVSGLSFATAEAKADPNVGTETLGDEIYFFGQNTVEPWYVTGNSDLPFEPSIGRTFDKGCVARGSIVKLDNALYFLGHDGVVYRASGTPGRVTDHGIEDILRKCGDIASVTAFGAVVGGHSLYVLNVPGQGSWCLDVENTAKGWAEWQSYGRAVFRGCNAILKNRVNYVGDDTTGTIWALTPDVYLDGTDPITFLGSCFAPHPGGPPIRCNNIVLQGARGVGLSGPANPNLLTAPKDFSDAAWQKTNATVTANTTVGPDGTTTGDRLNRTASGDHALLQQYTAGALAGRSFSLSLWLMAGTMTGDVLIRLQSSNGVSVFDVTATPSAAWANYTVSGTMAVGADTVVNCAINPVNNAGSAGDSLFLAQAELHETTPTSGGHNPSVEMRYSDDQGRTWSNWRATSPGLIGEYRKRPVWQRLGMIREPGRAFEFRMTDPVVATMAGVLMNVEYPHG